MEEFQKEDHCGGHMGSLWISAKNGENREKNKNPVYTIFNKSGWQAIPWWDKSTRPLYVSGIFVGQSRGTNSLYDEHENRRTPKYKTGLHS